MSAALALVFFAVAAEPEPLVDVSSVVPDAVLDLRYATPNNFLGQALYPPKARCLLRKSVAEKLSKAAQALREQGFRMKLFDCYRPRSVQWKMWQRLPKPGYVADPKKGSHHNRGAAVDLTLAGPNAEPVELPTDFDNFTRAAHHSFEGGTEASRRHREVLRVAMEAAGFKKNRMEWWHYEAVDARRFALADEPLEGAAQLPASQRSAQEGMQAAP